MLALLALYHHSPVVALYPHYVMIGHHLFESLRASVRPTVTHCPIGSDPGHGRCIAS